MGVQTIDIIEFLKLRHQLPVMDVRSPGEYSHAHIPGAYPLPLFNDEERKIVGTTYKQKSREQAIKAGLDFFKMRPMLEEAEKVIIKHSVKDGEVNRSVIVHCWRGGM
jgi:tRNA 2-selenouridine synthase